MSSHWIVHYTFIFPVLVPSILPNAYQFSFIYLSFIHREFKRQSKKSRQAVTGVVESVFDAGYLITIKIGNSNITLRGVAFKPKHYTPVTAQNDAALHLQMINGNDVEHHRQWRPKERYQRNADQYKMTMWPEGNCR